MKRGKETEMEIKKERKKHIKFPCDLGFQLSDPTSSANWYVVLRAADIFFATHKRQAGSHSDSLEKDTAQLITIVEDLLKRWGIDSAGIEYKKYAAEL